MQRNRNPNPVLDLSDSPKSSMFCSGSRPYTPRIVFSCTHSQITVIFQITRSPSRAKNHRELWGIIYLVVLAAVVEAAADEAAVEAAVVETDVVDGAVEEEEAAAAVVEAVVGETVIFPASLIGTMTSALDSSSSGAREFLR